MNFIQRLTAAVLSLTGATTFAAEFPEGSIPLASDALSVALAGKVFSVKPSQGPSWRWQFNGNGYFYINIGSFADNGKWSTKESSVCTEGRIVKPGCNEVRSLGSELYLMRSNGEVIKLEAQ